MGMGKKSLLWGWESSIYLTDTTLYEEVVPYAYDFNSYLIHVEVVSQ